MQHYLADYLLPIEPLKTIYKNHVLSIENDKIAAITPEEKFRGENPSANIEHLAGQLIMPGLVNSHTHLAMNLLRGIADDLPLMTWLNEYIWPREKEHVNEDFVTVGTKHAIAEMIRSGTTCFNDSYFFPNITAKVADEIGMRGLVGILSIDFPSNWASNTDEYLQKGQDTLADYFNHPLLGVTASPHAPYTVSDGSFEKIRQMTESLKLKTHIHLHETSAEIDGEMKQYNMRPIERLNKLGLLTPDTIAVHMTQLNDQDIDIIAKSGASVVHCPESNLKLASGFCPIAKLIENNINVAIGTDGAASNNDLDMFSETRTAALLAKAIANSPVVVPAEQALYMATLGGAKALGLDSDIGSIEVGKKADFISVELSDIESLPLYNPESQLVYATSRSQVKNSWINGKQVLKNRQLTTIDMPNLQQQLSKWHEKLKTQFKT